MSHQSKDAYSENCRPLAVSEAFNDPKKELITNAIEEVDWSVGEILKTLRKAGIAENTLVIFTSDNGAAVGSSLPLRAKKGSVYDGGIREPTVMWWPGKIPAGAVCSEVAASIDLMPTFVKLSGGEKQRVSLARAILKKSPILLCDEPTSSLDMQTELEIMNNLKEIANNNDVTGVIIAHRKVRVSIVLTCDCLCLT